MELKLHFFIKKISQTYLLFLIFGILRHMNVEEQKEKLVLEKKEIENELNSLGRELNDSGDWVVVVDNQSDEHADPSDEANLTEELESDIAVLNVLEKRHTQVEKALLAIKNNTYGICEVSGCKISAERLEANPSATTCIEHVG